MSTGRKLAAVGVVAALVVARPLVRAAEGHGAARPLSHRDLTAQLGPVTFPRPTARVYLTREKLAAYLDAVMPGASGRLPGIDFARDKAVLVSVGPRSSSGYALRVVSVTEQDGSPHVVLVERTPSARTRVVPGVTYPYRLITIPRDTGPTVIDLRGRP